jgi:hypothetical protein
MVLRSRWSERRTRAAKDLLCPVTKDADRFRSDDMGVVLVDCPSAVVCEVGKHPGRRLCGPLRP